MPQGPALGPASAVPAALHAPAAWQAIDFISDLHLCAAMPRTFAVWADYLRQTRADAVFMLGDLFEVWVGDDMAELPFEDQCRQVMADVGQRLHLAFMAGNRDVLLGAQMAASCRMQRLHDPTALHAFGSAVLLSHGDALCLDDVAYQRFRTEVRGAAWQADFLARPLAERLEIATAIRRASKERRQFDGDGDADIDPTHAERCMQDKGASVLVHGHTHRPGSGPIADGLGRHVLSDWDLDGADRAEVLRLDARGFTRLRPEDA